MKKKFKLDSTLFVEYYDSGAGNPFDDKRIMNFCIENIADFEDAGRQQDPECLECGKDGLNHTLIYPFYDDYESYQHLSKFIDNLPPYEDVPEEMAQLAVIYCTECHKWSVTH